jgi:hypothetical protein
LDTAAEQCAAAAKAAEAAAAAEAETVRASQMLLATS